MSNQRFFALGLIGLSACTAYVVAQLFASLLGLAGVTDFDVFGGIVLSALLGIGVTAVATVVLWRNPRFQEMGQEIAGELRKVTWPTWPEIRSATIAVVVTTIVSAVILGVYDFLSAKVLADWLPVGIGWARSLFV